MCVSMFTHRWLHVCAIHMQMCAEVRGYLRWPVLTNIIYISSWNLSLDLGFTKEAGQIGHHPKHPPVYFPSAGIASVN